MGVFRRFFAEKEIRPLSRTIGRIVPTLTFFIGKGGVGKTTVSSAYAVRLAMGLAKAPKRPALESRNVLLLSTDPAHSLADILETKLGDTPKQMGWRGLAERGCGRGGAAAGGAATP